MTTQCVSRCLEVPDRAQLAHDLRQIYQLIRSDAPLTPEARIEAGMRIRVRSGPLAGLEGTVIKRRGAERLLIVVHFSSAAPPCRWKTTRWRESMNDVSSGRSDRPDAIAPQSRDAAPPDAAHSCPLYGARGGPAGTGRGTVAAWLGPKKGPRRRLGIYRIPSGFPAPLRRDSRV